MKRMILGFVGMMAVTVSGWAKMPVPVADNDPGLPGQSQAYWDAVRAEQATRQARGGTQAAADGETNFYTGKPFDMDLGYLFKHRSYNPEMQRWTTMDPSGFPDGANNYNYCLIPNRDVDSNGLEVVIAIKKCGIINPLEGQVYQIKEGNTTASVSALADYVIEITRNASTDPTKFDLNLDFVVASISIFSGTIELSVPDMATKTFYAGPGLASTFDLEAETYVAALSLQINDESFLETRTFEVKE